MSWSLRCCSLLLLWTFIAPWATEGKVVESFAECSQFFCKGVEPLFFNEFNPSRICQRYQKQYHFATVYSTKLRIPLYSAYTDNWRSVPKINRGGKFFIEPQLDLPGGPDEMSEELDGVGMNQAINSDYRNQSYHRGHLCPFAFNRGTSTTTCTLTNVVPKTPEMNRHWYHYAERLIKGMLTACPPGQTLFVITGVIPSTSQFLNKRVNIPMAVFSYFSCCSENDKNLNESEEVASISGGYILRLDTKVPAVEAVTLAQLQGRFGSSIEVNPKWVNVAVSKNESHVLEMINEISKSGWLERMWSLKPSDVVATLFEAVSVVTRCVYKVVAWIIYGVLSVICELLKIVLGVISLVGILVNLLLAVASWLVMAIFRLIGYIFGRIGAWLAKGFLSIINSILNLIINGAQFLLKSIASIPTYITGIIANLFIPLSCLSLNLLQLSSFLLPTFSFLLSLAGLLSGIISLIAIWPNQSQNVLSKIIQLIGNLAPSVIKPNPTPRNIWKWLSPLISTFRDLMSKFWTVIFNFPPHWKMLVAIVSFLLTSLFGGWMIMSVLGSLFSLAAMVIAGIFGSIATVVLGLVSLVFLVPRAIGTLFNLCLTAPVSIFTTLKTRLFQYLATNFPKFSVHLLIMLLICFIIVCLIFPLLFKYGHPKTKPDSDIIRDSCKLTLSPHKVNIPELTSTPSALVSAEPPSFNQPSQIPVPPNKVENTVKDYFSYAKKSCVENFLPIFNICTRTVLVSAINDGTNSWYSRVFCIAAIAAGVIVIYNVMAYFISGLYICMCPLFTNIGLTIFTAIVIGMGLIVTNGVHFDSFLARIGTCLPTSLNTAFRSTATAIRDASRNRSPIMVSLWVIIFIMLIQISDPLKDIVTEFLQVIFFAGILTVLACVIKESMNPQK